MLKESAAGGGNALTEVVQEQGADQRLGETAESLLGGLGLMSFCDILGYSGEAVDTTCLILNGERAVADPADGVIGSHSGWMGSLQRLGWW